MAVTTIDIDERLLDEAKALLGTTTAEATVQQALHEVVAQRGQTAALDALADVDLDGRATTVDAGAELRQARD